MKYLQTYEKYKVDEFRKNLLSKLELAKNDSEYYSLIISFMKSFLKSRGYNYLAEGRNRMVFSSDSNIVIKIPKNRLGVYDNQEEYNVKKNSKLDIYPRVKLIDMGTQVLIMEKLNINVDLKSLDSDKYWWINCIDCMQVGWDSNGKLKAYDYGKF